jgi:post-segregation antitoxin (ccd killing protein)
MIFAPTMTWFGRTSRPELIADRRQDLPWLGPSPCAHGSDSDSIVYQQQLLSSSDVTTTRTTFTLDEALAENARRLGVNISAAARDGVEAAVRRALIEADRAAYARHPEEVDSFWTQAEAWGDE